MIIDLKERLVLPTHSAVENRHIVMTEQDKNVFGLLVDAVTEVLRIPETEIKAAPALVTQIDREYVDGVITRENRLIVLLDLEKVLSTKELARLTEFYQGDRWAKRTEKAKARPSEVQTEAAETEHKVPEPLPV